MHAQNEKNRLRSIYKEVNDDDNEALKIQMQIRDKINKKQSEIING